MPLRACYLLRVAFFFFVTFFLATFFFATFFFAAFLAIGLCPFFCWLTLTSVRTDSAHLRGGQAAGSGPS